MDIETLKALAEDRDFKKYLFEKALEKLKEAIGEQNTNRVG